MEIEVEITRKDYINFNKYYHFNKKNKKRLFFIIIIPLILSIFFNILRSFQFSTFLIEFFIFIILINTVYFLSLYLNIHSTAKKLLINGAILGKRKYIISKDGFKEVSDVNTNIQKWNGIKSIEQNNNSIFIFIEYNLAYTVPKRFFANEKHLSEFYTLINNYLNNEENK